jgi:hypothetical protein
MACRNPLGGQHDYKRTAGRALGENAPPSCGYPRPKRISSVAKDAYENEWVINKHQQDDKR